MAYKRILLKLSGDFFCGEGGQALDFNAIQTIADEIIALKKQGIEVGVVNGAGNIFRGRERPKDFDEVAAHRIGFMSGIPNSLALTETLNSKGTETSIMSSIEIPGIARATDPFRARNLLKKGSVVVFTGGTGDPFFTHDTAAVLRALEIQADILIKATDVDGVYSADPDKDPKATKYDSLTYKEALDQELGVLDLPAFALAQENSLPLLVCKFEPGNILKVLEDPTGGTIINN